MGGYSRAERALRVTVVARGSKATSTPRTASSCGRVGRPPLPASERREHRLNLALDPEMLGWLEARAAHRGETLHGFAVALVRKRMRKFVLVEEPPRELSLRFEKSAETLEVLVGESLVVSTGGRDLEHLYTSLEQLCELLRTLSPGSSP